MPRGTCTSIFAAAVAMLCGSIALPQAYSGGSAQTASTASSDVALEEIVVTAEKRTESARTIPISITAIGEAELKEAHVTDFAELSRAVPGLSFTTQGGTGLNNLEIRGVSSQAGGSTVAVYLDETPVSTPHILAAFVGTTEPDFLDVDRVEVLRGPQGTLYGASSMGGTIRFISHQPSLNSYDSTVAADLSGTDHGGFNYRTTAAVNVPLVNDLSAVRVAALYEHTDGWVDWLTQTGAPRERGVNDQEQAALRATWLIQPSEGVKVTPAVYVQRNTAGDTSVFFPSLGPYDEEKFLKEPIYDLFVLPSLTAGLRGEAVDFSSITSFLMRDFQHHQDGTAENSEYLASIAGSPPPVGFGYGANVLGDLPSPIGARTIVRQWSQELRLSSRSLEETGGWLTWVGGVYVSDQRVTYNEDDSIPGFNSTFESLYGVSAQSYFGAPFPDDAVYIVRNQYDERQYAAFGDATVKLADPLRFSAGLRYLEAREGFDLISGDFYGTGQQASIDHDHALTPRFTLTYLVSPEGTVYANAAKGYRLGGGNPVTPNSLCANDLANIGLNAAPTSYNPDSLWNYETGAKWMLFDNRVSVNGDFYWIKWDNIQQLIYLPTCGYNFYSNVGHARSYGTELEIHANATSYLTLSVAGGSTDATITENVKALNVQAGAHVLGVPEWTGDLGVKGHWAMLGLDEMFARADYALVGPSNGTFDPTQADYRRPAYQDLNLSAGLEERGMKVSLYMTNALDERKAIQHINNNFIIEAYTLQPPTLGLSVSKSF
ncbi:MAG TPA: TonB-dependent receptor [Steroidobacteraceae bacterium]|nr:TonB-dependent receptor [Steroidobacteraceae bacterium]